MTGEWLIIFVKAPTPGEVKTRLVPVLSAEQAASLYRCLVSDTLRAARALRDVQVVVAYAANRQFPDLTWLDEPPALFLQYGATLDERLEHAFRWAFQQHARSVLVIGSDAPDLSTRWLRDAFRFLRQCDVVVGPTTDGGYHLIGLRQPHPELFAQMPWSTSKLFGQTLHRVAELRLAVRCLEPIADLDTPDDLRGSLRAASLRRHTHITQFLKTLTKSHATGQVLRTASP